MAKNDENEIQIAEPILEAPPTAAGPSRGMGALFSDESVAVATAKVMVLETLLTLTTRDLKFHDFMREILTVVMKAVKSEAGSILELDHDNHMLFFRATVGTSSDRVSRFIIPVGQGVVGHVAESRQPLVVDNIDENRVYLKSVQDAVGFEARNVVAVPLLVRGRVYGVLELLNRVGEDNYSAEDVELLNYLCGVASKAIEIRLMLGWSLQQAGKKDAA